MRRKRFPSGGPPDRHRREAGVDARGNDRRGRRGRHPRRGEEPWSVRPPPPYAHAPPFDRSPCAQPWHGRTPVTACNHSSPYAALRGHRRRRNAGTFEPVTMTPVPTTAARIRAVDERGLLDRKRFQLRLILDGGNRYIGPGTPSAQLARLPTRRVRGGESMCGEGRAPNRQCEETRDAEEVQRWQ